MNKDYYFINILRKYSKELIFGFVFSVIVYSTFMTQQLTNTYDSLWRQNYDIKGNWELSLGRWMQPYVDIIHLGMHTDPMASIVAISFFVFGLIVILDMFEVNSRAIAYIAMALFLSSTLVSITLSYKQFSIMYGLSFMFSSISAHIIFGSFNRKISIPASASLLCMTMAIYQPYIAVFFLLVVFKIIVLIIASEPMKKVWTIALNALLSCMAGAVFYLAGLFIRLNMQYVELNSYHSANRSLSVYTVIKLPQSILRLYRLFIGYFWDSKDNYGYFINVFQSCCILRLFLILSFFIFILIGIRLWKNDSKMLAVYTIAVLFIPIACNVELLMAADEDLTLQMTTALALYVSLILILIYKIFSNKFFIRVSLLLFGFIVFGNILQVQIDQNAMYEGQNATNTMIYDILHDLNDEDLISKEYEYFFVGQPGNNEFFYTTPLFDKANDYGRVGFFWLGGKCMMLTYEGIINKRLGYYIRITQKEYEEYAYDNDVMQMPVYPEKGYIMIKDKDIIVKISN